jgi:hypothetical protein
MKSPSSEFQKGGRNNYDGTNFKFEGGLRAKKIWEESISKKYLK